MQLNDLEQAMHDGQHGKAAQWAMGYQQRVGEFFDAEDFVEIRLIHISTDRETIGDSGIAFIEELTTLPLAERRPRAFAVADFRGFDAETFRFLLPGRDLATQSEEAVQALGKLGIVTSHAYINDHSVTAPGFGESCGYSGTPSVIYMNSIVGARCNFEAGPSSLAAYFTGRVPRYGFHLDANRRATDAFRLAFRPEDVSEWGAVGAIIGRRLNSYWHVPAIEVPGARPTNLALNHLGLCLASYGSHAMFHVIGVTPEAPDWPTAFGGPPPEPEVINRADLDAFFATWAGAGERLDVVPLSTPQLTLPEVMQVAELLQGRQLHSGTTLLVYTPIEIKQACERLGVKAIIEAAGGWLVHGHDFFATYAKEIREAHGWERMMTHSVKMTNICEGYGYKPTPASIERCVASAIAGRVMVCA
jgi:predicted aconitase